MNDIKNTLFNLTKKATTASGDLLKTTKLNFNLSTEEASLNKLYVEIGKKVHEIYLYGGSLGKFFDEKYREIETCEQKIAELKEQIGVIKGTRDCPKCGKAVERSAEFCPKCGLKMDSAAPATTPEALFNQTPVLETPHTSETVLPHADYSYVPESMPAQAQDVPSIQNTAQTTAAQAVCRICGGSNPPGTKFCLSCGRMLD